MFPPPQSKTSRMLNIVAGAAATGNDKSIAIPNIARELERIIRKWYI